jgi:hypothetical protein
MFFVFVVLISLMPLAFLALLAAFLLVLLQRFGFLRRRRAGMIMATIIMVSLPLTWFVSDQIELTQCMAIKEPNDLYCGGELGGVMIFFCQFFLLISSIIVGPIIGSRLHGLWARPV